MKYILYLRYEHLETLPMKYTVLFVLISLIFLTSCGKDSPRFVIGVSQCSDDDWRHKMNSELQREALFYNGVEVDIRTAKDNNQRQIEDIKSFITEGVDLLIVAPNEAAPITPVVEEAYDKGIPVIVVDRKILSDKYTAYVGADNFEIGKAVGNYVATRLKGKGTVAEITGLAGSSPAVDRHQGFMSAISKHPEITLLAKEDAGWLQSPAEEKMDSLLWRYPKIDVVFAQNDRMATGAYLAADREHRSHDIAFVGIDALPGQDNGVDLVLKGVLDATFIYPTGGEKVMEIAMNILEKKDFPRETILNTAIVDMTNARVMKLQTDQIEAQDKRIEALNTKVSDYLDSYSKQQIVILAIFVILLLFIGMFALVWQSLLSKNRMNKELSKSNDEITKQKEQLESQRDQLIELSRQLEEATHAKLVFFTNISHDFRTPLTLVADPVEQLLCDGNLTESQQQQLSLVKKNVNILLRLVNQILDFRKYENGKLELNLSKANISVSLEEWSTAFLAAARKKHIKFSFDYLPDTDFTAVVDTEKLERSYFNLLSNAFKFTPENGKIQARLSLTPDSETRMFRLTVSNTGSIISPEHIKNIFNRFYKIDMHHAGSGIGLALVKAFVDMHNGKITVESNEKFGTVFIIDMPFEQVGYCDNEGTSAIVPDTAQLLSDLPDTVTEEKVPAENGETVLIIDDNPDIRSYIHQLLQHDYTVIEAADGTEGIRQAMKYVPDVIVSDVMMPGMDGVECCRRLKSEMQTCHIPVILLTACSLDEQRIEGFDSGADSYISKPFNSQVLVARIRNLVDNHKRLRQFFGDNVVLEKENIGDMDKSFVEKFRNLIEENMSDSGLNVEELGRSMGMSRVQLYRKIKSLTNYSPNELLRIARLKKAASLLASSDMTIAEITYEVGFTSPSYFTKCYKEYFGENPTDFLKRKG